MASHGYGPAVGTKGARKPLQATIRVPDFVRFDRAELQFLLNRFLDPLVDRLYLLLCAQADFSTGEVLTNYPRLIALCSPPQGEQGGRTVKPPTYDQVRKRLDLLEASKMIRRDKRANQAQGMLRIFVTAYKKKTTPAKR